MINMAEKKVNADALPARSAVRVDFLCFMR
jgi:hypothetical protein